MHIACAIEQNLQRRQLVEHAGDRGVVEDVEPARRKVGNPLQPLDCRGIDVGCNDGSAFPRHREGARMADALARGRDERGLAFESSGHGSCARNGEFYAQCNKPIGVPPRLRLSPLRL